MGGGDARAQSADAAGDAERDRALVRRMVAGEGAALTALARIYKGNVWGLAMRYARDTDAAADIVQAALKEMWDRRAEYDPARPVIAWMLRIVKTRALNYIRDEKTRDRRERDAEETSALQKARPGMELAELRLMRERLLPALEELTEEQRRTVELVYFEELSHSEAAARTGQTKSTVGSQVRLALVKLRKALGGGEGAEPSESTG